MLDYNGQDLSEQDFIDRDLTGASFVGANLRGADLRGATLAGANLIGADLSNANLAGADLEAATLLGANLEGADITGTNLLNTVGDSRVIQTIQDPVYIINITKELIWCGCIVHTKEDWLNFSNEDIENLYGKGPLHWWKKWRPILEQIISKDSGSRDDE